MIVDLNNERAKKLEDYIKCGDNWIHYKNCKGEEFKLFEDELEFNVRISEEVLVVKDYDTIPVYVAVSDDGILTTCIHFDREEVLKELVESFVVIQTK